MAAGLSIRETDFSLFQRAFDELVDQLLPLEARTHSLAIDGPLVDSELCLNTAKQLADGIWGQGFPADFCEPLFRFLNPAYCKTST